MDSTSDDDARHSDLSSTQTNGVNNNGVTENHNSSSTPSVKAQNYHGFLQSNHFSLCPPTHPNFALHRVDAPYPAQQFYGTRLPYQGFMRTSPFFPYDSQNSDASVTTVNTETPNSQKKPRKKVTKNTKAPQPNQHSNSRVTWTMEEDVALTKAWLYVTQDAITGRDQPSDRMWNRIWGVWRDNMVNPDGRGWNALKCHWKGIQTQVCKFHGIYEMLERHPPSGNKLQDIVRFAYNNFFIQYVFISFISSSFPIVFYVMCR